MVLFFSFALSKVACQFQFAIIAIKTNGIRAYESLVVSGFLVIITTSEKGCLYNSLIATIC